MRWRIPSDNPPKVLKFALSATYSPLPPDNLNTSEPNARELLPFLSISEEG
jgi:hypothetical protein